MDNALAGSTRSSQYDSVMNLLASFSNSTRPDLLRPHGYVQRERIPLPGEPSMAPIAALRNDTV
jgi:hypothetical protein